MNAMRVVRSEGSIDLASRAPDPRLRSDVVRLTGYVESFTRPVRYDELPPPFAAVIVNVGTPYRVVGVEQRGSFVGGLTESPVVVETDGAALCVQVDLEPLAAARLLGVPMHELASRTAALADVLGAQIERLEAQLHDAPDWESRLSLVESFVLTRLAEAQPMRADVAYAWARLVETGGRLRIRDLASELGCSRKHLTVQFRDNVGLSPKATARLIRFNVAARLLQDGVGGAEVAFRCGFADQAHLVNEFRRFSGTTPGAFARETPVPFLQDDARRAA